MSRTIETRLVFGKKNPYNYGVMPVLVVIQNDGPKNACAWILWNWYWSVPIATA